jgi:hypothetical protein
LPTKGRVRVYAATPFALTVPVGSLTGGQLCHVTRVEGYVARVVGDTVILHAVDRAVAVPAASGARTGCPTFEGTTTFVRNAEMEFSERKVNAGKTIVLVVALAAIVIGIAAAGASQIEPGFKSEAGSR